MRIETKQAPKPSQPEVVLSDGEYWHLIVAFESSTHKQKLQKHFFKEILFIYWLSMFIKSFCGFFSFSKDFAIESFN